MTASFKAEWLKLRKRQLTWLSGGVLVTMVVVMGYVFLYTTLRNLAGNPANADEVESIRLVLNGENAALVTLDVLGRFGGVVTVLFGATLAGSEYGWNTVKTVMTQRGPRRQIVLGTVAAHGALVATVVMAGVAAAWTSSLAVGALADIAPNLPDARSLLPAMGATWLVLMAYLLLGAALAAAIRGAALAVGIGLIYVMALETLIGALAGNFTLLGYIDDYLVRSNAIALTQFFTPEAWQGGQVPAIGPWQAVSMLALFAAGAVAAMLALQRRDYA